MSSPDFDAVSAVMQAYFDGLYHADTARLAPVFHPQAGYVGTTPGQETVLSMPDYFRVVDARTPPSADGQVRRDRVLSIRFGGPALAFVHAEMAMMGRRYTDFLTLTKHEDRWCIVAKVFHFETETKE
ncbi:MAG: nuclear transport factor 2 family protein [Alphaproteobacteria bacterium]